MGNSEFCVLAAQKNGTQAKREKSEGGGLGNRGIAKISKGDNGAIGGIPGKSNGNVGDVVIGIAGGVLPAGKSPTVVVGVCCGTPRDEILSIKNGVVCIVIGQHNVAIGEVLEGAAKSKARRNYSFVRIETVAIPDAEINRHFDGIRIAQSLEAEAVAAGGSYVG